MTFRVNCWIFAYVLHDEELWFEKVTIIDNYQVIYYIKKNMNSLEKLIHEILDMTDLRNSYYFIQR